MRTSRTLLLRTPISAAEDPISGQSRTEVREQIVALAALRAAQAGRPGSRDRDSDDKEDKRPENSVSVAAGAT
jgi:hypothetical protein